MHVYSNHCVHLHQIRTKKVIPFDDIQNVSSRLDSLRLRNDALVISRGDVIEGSLEVLARVLQASRILVGVEIGVD